MLNGFEDVQKTMRDSLDTSIKALGSVTKGWQAIAAETAEYTRKSFEDGSAAVEKLLGARSLDAAFEIQSGYARAAYDAAVGQATKITEMVMDLAKDAARPFDAATQR